MKKSFLTALCCMFILGASGCTVDAELASNLLKSLKDSVQTANSGADAESLDDVLNSLGTEAPGDTGSTLSADELNALLPAELAAYQLVCAGSGEMQIAAYRDRQQSAAPTPPQPARLRPQVVQMGAQPQNVNISIDIQSGLQRMAQIPAPERAGYYRELQQRYPQLREAQPVTVARPNGQREVVFAYPAAATMPSRPVRTLAPEETASSRASGLVGCQLIPAEAP